jgi:competence protein ComEC
LLGAGPGLNGLPAPTAVPGPAAGPGRAARLFDHAEAWLDAERDQLILWAPVMLGLGIALWFLLPAPGQWVAAAALALAVASAGLALPPGRLGRVLCAGGALVALGVGAAWARAELAAAPRLAAEQRAIWLTATVERVEDRSGREQWRLFLKPHDPALPPRVRIALRAPPEAAIRPGAQVRLRATLRPPPGPLVPGGYDYSRRAWFEGVGAIGHALGPIGLVSPAPARVGPLATVETWRSALNARVRALVPGPSGAIASAFVTGDQGGIPEPVAQVWRDAGIAHMLSVGGLHIAVVVGVAMVGTRRLLALSPRLALGWPLRTIAALAGALAAIAYATLAGLQVPIVRAALAALFVLAGILLGRQALALRSVAIAAFAILLVRPEALMGPSFQLTFAAIVALVAAFNTRWGRRLLEPGEDEGAPARWRRRGLALLVGGVVAQAALAPIALYHFNRDGLFGVASNLVAIPLTEFVGMPLLMLMLVAETVGAGAPFGWALGQLLDLVTAIGAWFAGLPGAVARLPAMPLAAFAAIIGGGLWLSLWAGRARLLGLAPIAAGLAAAASAGPADLFVTGDGRHLGVVAADGRVAMLRPRAGSFVRDMMGDAAGTGATLPLEALPNAHCTPDACLVRLTRGGREWRVLATRSRHWIARVAFEPACAAADIVVSDRQLPAWCRPAWLRLDPPALAASGAVAIRLGVRPRVSTAAQVQGAHPWAVALHAAGATPADGPAAR